MGDTKGEYKVGPTVEWVLVWISPILWISIRRDSLISVTQMLPSNLAILGYEVLCKKKQGANLKFGSLML